MKDKQNKARLKEKQRALAKEQQMSAIAADIQLYASGNRKGREGIGLVSRRCPTNDQFLRSLRTKLTCGSALGSSPSLQEKITTPPCAYCHRCPCDEDYTQRVLRKLYTCGRKPAARSTLKIRVLVSM